MNPGLPDPRIHLALPTGIWVAGPWFETPGSMGCEFLLVPWVDFVDEEQACREAEPLVAAHT